MTIIECQRDISRAFVGGGPGVFVSGLMWFAAAYVEATRGTEPGFVMLFVGGMLIFPLALLLSRFLFGRAKEAANNPLGPIALESTIAMIGGLLAGWLMLSFDPGLVFPLAAIAVGTHYFVFKTIYGDRLFWLLGALISAVGLFEIFDVARIPGGPVLAVGAIEITFGMLLTVRELRAGDRRKA